MEEMFAVQAPVPPRIFPVQLEALVKFDLKAIVLIVN